MFGSISKATPNSIVTTSFVADEACRVGIEGTYTVRVNGQTTSARPITLQPGDQIDLAVESPGSDSYKFVPWTYNGNGCYFAIATRSSVPRPKLRKVMRGKMWSDFAVSDNTFRYENASLVESAVSLSGPDNDPQTNDLVALLDIVNNKIHFHKPSDGSRVYSLTLDAKPIAHGVIWNGALSTWESVALDSAGALYNWTNNRSRVKRPGFISNAKYMFTDGSTIFFVGEKFVSIYADPNTHLRTYNTTETIQYGVAMGDVVIVTTKSGKALKLGPTGLEELFQSNSIGAPAVYQNQFVFPLTDEYKLKFLNAQGLPSREISTGDFLPWAINSWRDVRMAVAGADSPNVLVYSDLALAPQIRVFDQNVTFAIPSGDSIFTSHILRDQQFTIPPNPVVTGAEFRTWTAPVGVDAGTGEYVVHTVGEDLMAAVSPNATLRINGSKTITGLNEGSVVQLCQTANLGRTRSALVIGNYAFDFTTKGVATPAIATFIDTQTKTKAKQLVWTFDVPQRVVDAPIALTVGTLQVDGSVYDGSTPVNANQRLTITINVPEDVNYYHSVLSIADAQYPLIMSVAVNKEADVQRFQEYSSTATVSTIKVDETGRYDLPNYRNAQVTKNGEVLSFPTTLTKDDELVVRHIQTSAWWLDRRDTVLIGPSTNYYMKSFTVVNDKPQGVNFGTIHDGIPDFDYDAENEVTISGLSEGYAIAIFSEYMKFSVNGGAFEVSPLVQNGDKIRARYTVKNLFEIQEIKNRLADDSADYTFGYLSIDPAKGQLVPVNPLPDIGGLGEWIVDSPLQDQVELNGLRVQTHIEPVVANTPEKVVRTIKWDKASTPQNAVPLNIWSKPITPLMVRRTLVPGVASKAAFNQSSQGLGAKNIPLNRPFTYRTTPFSSGLFSRPTTALSNNLGSRRVQPGVPLAQAAVGRDIILPTMVFNKEAYTFEYQARSFREAKAIEIVYEGMVIHPATFTYKPMSYIYDNKETREVLTSPGFDAPVGQRLARVGWLNPVQSSQRSYWPGWVMGQNGRLRSRNTSWFDVSQKAFRTKDQVFNVVDPSLRFRKAFSEVQQETQIRFVNQSTRKLTRLFRTVDQIPQRMTHINRFVDQVPEKQTPNMTLVNQVPSYWIANMNFVSQVVALPEYANTMRFKQGQFTTDNNSTYYVGVVFGYVSENLNYVERGSFVDKIALKSVVFAATTEAPANEITTGGQALAQSDTHWETFVPELSGGYATAEEAKAAGKAYSPTLPLTVYRQPEGTFSFVVKRNTGLVCHLKGTNIIAVKWLIGGG